MRWINTTTLPLVVNVAIMPLLMLRSLRPELVKLCGDMDSTGLHKFVSDNRKNLASIKEEIPLAFKAASNPASLVLDSLEGFYPIDGKKDGVIGVLLDSGRLIDAVNLAFAFELTQQFPPVELLESYLTEAKRSPDKASATVG